MNILEKIKEEYPEGKYLIADGFDDAAIGIEYGEQRLIYSMQKMIEILQKDMEWTEAIEYLEFNTLGAYVWEHTPISLDDTVLPEDSEIS